MSPAVPRRNIAWHGLASMLLGLALIALELRYSLLLTSSGSFGRAAMLILGTILSVFGLKELIAGWWPGLRSRRSAQLIRHRFMLPVEGQVYAVIMTVLFAGSLLGRSNMLLLVFSMMAGPFVLNGGIVYSMLNRLVVRRSLPQRVMAGEPFSVEIALRNPKRWLSVWLMAVRDQVDNGRERLHPEVLFMRVPRRSERAGRYQLRLSQRGRYQFGPVQVNSRFPLGLVERGLVLAEAGQVLVYPRIGRLSTGWRRKLVNATELVTQSRSHVGAFDDDFHRIREYRPGDDPRADSLAHECPYERSDGPGVPRKPRPAPGCTAGRLGTAAGNCPRSGPLRIRRQSGRHHRPRADPQQSRWKSVRRDRWSGAGAMGGAMLPASSRCSTCWHSCSLIRRPT